jgi:vacuolar protein sorting-associated protein 26
MQNITGCRYHLKDVIVGKIYFLLVRIKIKNMELEIRRRESTGSGPNTYVETETLAKFELMDGAPVRGTLHIFPLFLSSFANCPVKNYLLTTWLAPNH